MDEQELAAVVLAGEQLHMVKLLITGVNALWVYDYLLTLGDEITYAWSAGPSWTFALFIANRYFPTVHLIWVNITMFHYGKPFCEHTKWIPIFHSTGVTALAQIVVGLRVYAVTGRNKLIGGLLALFIFAQGCQGLSSVVLLGLRPLQPLPEINLDVFKICIYKRWRLGELVYYHLAIAFDIVAFLIILITARRSRVARYPGMPTILDTILRDATHYFVLMFIVQLVSVLFDLFAPEEIQLMPGIANTIFVPVMASRLMLSLKKAVVRRGKPWTLGTFTSRRAGMTTGDEAIRFAPLLRSELHGVSQTCAAAKEEDIELDSAPRLPPNRHSHDAC